MNYKYDISIIIVNYNGIKYLKNLFNSLINLKHDNIKFEVIFVDNASTDNSIQYICDHKYKELIDIKLICNDENQGFAQGNNTGVKSSSGEFVIFLNSDTAVDHQWLEKLYKCINSNYNFGMVASKLLFFYDFIKISFLTQDKIVLDKKIKINGIEYSIDNKFCKNLLYGEQLICLGNTEIGIPLLYGIANYEIEFNILEYNMDTDYILACSQSINIDDNILRIKFTKEDILSFKYAIIQNAGSDINENYDGFDIGMGEADAPKYNFEREINLGCGAAIILRREDFDNVGGFDERFFMYYEDVDLSFKIKSLGKKIIYCPEAVVRHIHTGSSKEWSPFFSYHVYRNKLLFIYNNISKIMFFSFFIKQLASSLKHKDKIKFRATLDAIKVSWFNKNCTY